MRYKNGGPVSLYVLVEDSTGRVIHAGHSSATAKKWKLFEEKRKRPCTLLTYVQKGSK